MSKLFKDNRKRFAKAMDNNSLFISFAGRAGISSGDQFYPFTPKRNFYYLTGIESQHIIFTLHKSADGTVTETLYLERFDEVAAKWIGASLGEEEAKKTSGIEKYRLIEQFEGDIGSRLFASDNLKVYMDLSCRSLESMPSSETAFARKIQEKHPYVQLINAFGIFARLRAIKSKDEIKNIKKAIDVTKGGIYLMMQNSKPGMMEYEYEAYFDYHLLKNGVREHAFNTIAAAGNNATVLHYSDNNCAAKDGDLILFDLGASYSHYSADITRTFPVNGVFTERQKVLYNIVLEAWRKVVARIKPGLPFKELNETVIEHYAKELKRIDLIKDKSEVSKYYYHGVSHPLGLDTHDVSRGRDIELQEGMILTVEPGLYIAEENIGIRIEDDVLVTAEGCEVLSSDIIRTADEIEALMSGREGKRRGNK